MDPEPRSFVLFYSSVFFNSYISLVFRGSSFKLYPDVDMRFTDIFTPDLHIYLSRITVLSSQIKSAVDRRCFTVRVSDDHEQEIIF